MAMPDTLVTFTDDSTQWSEVCFLLTEKLIIQQIQEFQIYGRDVRESVCPFIA